MNKFDLNNKTAIVTGGAGGSPHTVPLGTISFAEFALLMPPSHLASPDPGQLAAVAVIWLAAIPGRPS